jgi:multiple sugar transport system permease protein
MAALTTSPAAPVAAPKAPRGHVRRITGGLVVGYVLIGIYSLTLLLPLYWLLISAFKDRYEVFGRPLTPTFSKGFANFVNVWEQLDAGRALINSGYITIAALALTLLVAIPASYGLARAKGRIGTIVERIYAMGFLIPGFAALVPTLLLAIGLNMYHTREFMILYLSASAQPLAVILLTQFMRTVPPELEEAALIDGAGRFRILRSVYLPLVVPGIATITILQFNSYWNEYLYTLIITGVQPAKRTIQVALPTLVSHLGNTDYAWVCAGTIISILPVFILYIVLNRRMEDAMVQGALKG